MFGKEACCDLNAPLNLKIIIYDQSPKSNYINNIVVKIEK